MKIILKTFITTTALAASLSLASAKSVDGYGSAGLNDLDFKLAVSAITQNKVCDNANMKRIAFMHIEKSAAETDIPVSVISLLASRRADKIIDNWKPGQGVPQIAKSVCGMDLDQQARFGSFGMSRISMNMTDRKEVGKQAYALRDIAMKYRALSKAERSDCLSDHRAYKAEVVKAGWSDQIKKTGQDPYTIIWKSWSASEIDNAKTKAYGELDTCELADRLLSKQR